MSYDIGLLILVFLLLESMFREVVLLVIFKMTNAKLFRTPRDLDDASKKYLIFTELCIYNIILLETRKQEHA